MSAATQPESTESTIDQVLADLEQHKQEWAVLGIPKKIELLKSVRIRCDQHAERWADAAIAAKGIPADSPLTGEEWGSGPWALLYGVEHLIRTLTKLDKGTDLLAGCPIRTTATGQVAVQVHPADIFDKLLLNSVTAEVWMEPEITESNLRDNLAEFYRESAPIGKVALVLGAGNIASIAPLDVLYKLYAEGQVCVLKMNPVNEYLGPIFEDIFSEFVYAGFVRFVYGGVEVGKILTFHDLVEEIHITGAERTHDAIVYGVGADGTKRKKADNPLNPRRVSSELGGVGPTIVVPGPWSSGDIKFQAEHVVTQKTHNGGFNCVAAQVLVLPEVWDKSDEFLDAIKSTMRSTLPRHPYYPGALERVEKAKDSHANVDVFDESRILLEGIHHQEDHYAFKNEFFSTVLAQTSLPGDDAEEFLRNAVDFANSRLHGTLGANILIHPKTIKALGPKFDEIIGELKYGTIAINAWVGVGFLMARATWGAFPGHLRNDIQSGVGVVHNALLFDKPQKTVVRAPFREFPASLGVGETSILPHPPWFVKNKMGHKVMQKLTRFSADPGWKHLPGIFKDALRG